MADEKLNKIGEEASTAVTGRYSTSITRSTVSCVGGTPHKSNSGRGAIADIEWIGSILKN